MIKKILSYASFMSFAIATYRLPDGRYQGGYWPRRQCGRRYQTLVCDTPQEARRLARLVIKGGLV